MTAHVVTLIALLASVPVARTDDVPRDSIASRCPFTSTLLATGDANLWDPSWSPDGQSIAYINDSRNGRSRVRVIPSCGGTPRVVSPDSIDATGPITWFPASDRLVCGTVRHAILLIDVKDGKTVIFAKPGQAFLGPTLSPDGRFVAFDVFIGPHERRTMALWLLPTDGGEPFKVSPDSSLGALYSVWSPDSRAVVWRSTRPGTKGLWRQPIPTGEPQRIPGTEEGAGWAGWAPDGQRIAFVEQQGSMQGIIRIASIAGGRPRVLFIVNGDATNRPVWSPDGRWLAYDVVGGDGSDVWLCSVESGGLIRISDGRGTARSPAWAPDGRTLAFVNGRGELWIADTSCL
jgi:Tol biopolymer transport system component